MNGAPEYIRSALADGALTVDHVEELVRFYQAEHGLMVDGKPGPQTRAVLEAEHAARVGPPAIPGPRCWPLRSLADGRKPRVTSGFKAKNPDRPNHNGCDLFYRYQPEAGDPPMKAGDGGRTSSGWWIPDGTSAVAGAAGTVVLAGASKTGFRVWIDIGGGWHIGYFHLTKLDVSVGEKVAMGKPVGIVGDNPVDIDARHLHFELYYGELGTYPRGCQDPEAFLEGARGFTG